MIVSSSIWRRLVWVSWIGVLGSQLTAPSARPLNDTGVTECSNGTQTVPCSTVQSSHPGQDARYGRDVASGTSAAGSQVGFGSNGFDFTKVSLSGTNVTPTATFGASAGQFACIRDNVTGLLWYGNAGAGTWRDSNPQTNGGSAGNSSQPNTESTINTVNGAAACARSNWRLPTVRELMSVLKFTPGSACGSAWADPALPWPAQEVFWTSQTPPQNTGSATVLVVGLPGIACLLTTRNKITEGANIVLVSG